MRRGIEIRSTLSVGFLVFAAVFACASEMSASAEDFAGVPASLAGKTLLYAGEPGTDTKMRIKISRNGKTYTASISSGRFQYKCAPGKMLANGRFGFAPCDTISSADPNYDNEWKESPDLAVDGYINEVSMYVGRGQRSKTLKLYLVRQTALVFPDERSGGAILPPSTEAPTRKPDTRPSGDGTLNLASSGSGFFVSRTGHVLTNRHVVDKCSEVRIAGAKSVRHIATGNRVDLALLQADVTKTEIATFRGGRGVRIGEDIIVAGYPLRGLLSSGLTVTKGIVSSNIGPQNDQNTIQITAPVQQGNSGGPVLDASGNVVGVVFSKLNALKFAKVTGSLPQNVNFAISAGSIRAFLDGHSVPYDIAPSKTVQQTADIAEKARNYTVLVECWK